MLSQHSNSQQTMRSKMFTFQEPLDGAGQNVQPSLAMANGQPYGGGLVQSMRQSGTPQKVTSMMHKKTDFGL